MSSDNQELLDVIRDEWLELGNSTQPADRNKAELGSWEAYEAIGERVPKLKIWVQSPMAGVLASTYVGFALDDNLKPRLMAELDATLKVNVPEARKIRRDVDRHVWQTARKAVHNQIAAELESRTAGWERWRTEMGNYVWDQVWQEIGDPIYSQGWEQEARRSDGLFEENLTQWSDAMMEGQLSAGMLAQLDALELLGHADANRFKGIRRAARSCCWWWAYDVGALFCERPAVCDISGKHGHIEFRDGWTVEF